MLFRAAVGVLILANGELTSPLNGPLAAVESVDGPDNEFETVTADPEAAAAELVAACANNLCLSSSSDIAYADLHSTTGGINKF